MPSTSQSPRNTNSSTAQQSRANRTKGSSPWLQTLLITGSLAATGVGALMINQLETSKANSATDEVPAFDTAALDLQPIPTVMVPPTAVEVAAVLPTATPTAVAQSNQVAQVVPTDTVAPTDTAVPTDTPVPTITPQPTATSVVQQQSTFTSRVQRRSRSSR